MTVTHELSYMQNDKDIYVHAANNGERWSEISIDKPFMLLGWWSFWKLFIENKNSKILKLTSWFWYAVTAEIKSDIHIIKICWLFCALQAFGIYVAPVKTVSGNTNVLKYSVSRSLTKVPLAIIPSRHLTRWTLGWYRCIEFKTSFARTRDFYFWQL